MKRIQILDVNSTKSNDSASLKFSSLTMQELSEHEKITIIGGLGCPVFYDNRYAY
jgi:hypothetical protein